jgi:hypothetical protein
MSEIHSGGGNWKRHICAWWGHDNIGVRNLLYGTGETLCLRCRSSSWVVPEWSPFRIPQPDPDFPDPGIPESRPKW